jgi:hypothetical protein
MKKKYAISPRLLYKLMENKLERVFFNASEPEDSEIDIKGPFVRSTKALGSYVTLNWDHKQNISSTIQIIKDYAADDSLRRPLNIIMLAEPGSGKTHFVKCLAENLKDNNVVSVTYNMATMKQPEDLIQPLDVVRNHKVQDKLPILFLDEFDSEEKNYPILLPLLWDGEIHLGHRELKMGKLIIMLAGSNPKIRMTIEEIQKMEKVTFNSDDGNKLIDLLSRINGGQLEIPKLDLRKTDKICLTISLLKYRFGDNLRLVPWSLLKFIGETKFRYGVRSISLLIDLIPYSSEISDRITIHNLKLPLTKVEDLRKSRLAFHIIPSEHDKDINGIIERWTKICDYEALVSFMDPLEEEE